MQKRNKLEIENHNCAANLQTFRLFLTKYFLLENTSLQNSEFLSVVYQVQWSFHQKKALQQQK